MNNKNNNKWYGFIPNLFTLLNLACGVVGTYLSINGKIQTAIILMFIAALFDFFDGFSARLLKVSGELGKQLDSLADLISFGVVPAAMIFYLQTQSIQDFSLSGNFSIIQYFFLLSPVLIPVFSALRLAKFNIDDRQKSEFFGLPTPANGLFLASLSWTLIYKPDSFIDFMNNPFALAITSIIFSLLLVSNISLFALKFSTFKFKPNSIRYVFLLFSIVLIACFGITGILFVVLLYIILSIIRNILCEKSISQTSNSK